MFIKDPPSTPPIHKNKPSRSNYTAGCRCDGCRTVNRDYQREYARRKAFEDEFGKDTLEPKVEK